MTRALLTLYGKTDRERARRWVDQAPLGTRVEFRETKRSIPQSDKMWAMLTDVAAQKEHFGRKYDPPRWKLIFMHALGQEIEFIPSLDGSTFIPCGGRSSELSKDEMSELLEFIAAWGAENGVVFHDGTEGPEHERASV